jgi:dipeptidyl aminopeptidase/acylaminoacyl peptidase
MNLRLALIGLVAAAAYCAEIYTDSAGPYIPPPVQGDDGRRLLWKPKGTYENPEEYQCYEPDFSPDGRKVVASYRNGEFGRDGRVAILDLASGELKQIVIGNSAKRPDWSPTGEWIAYQSDNPSYIGRTIWIVRPDGTENHRLKFNWAYCPKWGPEGRRLYFLLHSLDHRRLDAVYYDFTEEKLFRLHYSDEYGHRAAVPSPDGEQVALNLFNSRKVPTDIILAFVKADGTGFNIVWRGLASEAGWPVEWSPGGRFIIVSYDLPLSYGQALWTYDVTTAAVGQLTMCPPKLNFQNHYGASWGPNGDIVFATDHGWLYLIKAPE